MPANREELLASDFNVKKIGSFRSVLWCLGKTLGIHLERLPSDNFEVFRMVQQVTLIWRMNIVDQFDWNDVAGLVFWLFCTESKKSTIHRDITVHFVAISKTSEDIATISNEHYITKKVKSKAIAYKNPWKIWRSTTIRSKSSWAGHLQSSKREWKKERFTPFVDHRLIVLLLRKRISFSVHFHIEALRRRSIPSIAQYVQPTNNHRHHHLFLFFLIGSWKDHLTTNHFWRDTCPWLNIN